ncbi:MAG: hypothetical protein GWN01_02560 [Nitrosopumilaceae archaeon]|nr:hypothetical protein [Nitrosopumilaceae archaeon]NIT99849.1 hypothetical protein [Nitrosopumilaceae archaeon]NIU86212.1 hypothetical protein [Nitrosopumilaceae archaeon]NIV64974.1 hypothetical protein [Nitrosopumilaceae archaeon]NIX60452.1 hypothetical protein [Nitrosopumilaceae archaeon]
MKSNPKKKIRDIAREVLDFSTDGCTMAPDLDFFPCCDKHDFAYRNNHITGISRWDADWEMKECIKKRPKGKYLAWIYWLGARVLGWAAFYDFTPKATKQSIEGGFGWYS